MLVLEGDPGLKETGSLERGANHGESQHREVVPVAVAPPAPGEEGQKRDDEGSGEPEERHQREVGRAFAASGRFSVTTSTCGIERDNCRVSQWSGSGSSDTGQTLLTSIDVMLHAPELPVDRSRGPGLGQARSSTTTGISRCVAFW